jgi:nitrile hydratase accessory protein
MNPLAALTSAEAKPNVLTDLVFQLPWFARLFGLTLALAEKGCFTHSEFQAAMIKNVGEYERTASIEDDTVYYTRWMIALLELLKERRLASDDAIAGLERQIKERLATLHDHDHEHHHAHAERALHPIIVA